MGGLNDTIYVTDPKHPADTGICLSLKDFLVGLEREEEPTGPGSLAYSCFSPQRVRNMCCWGARKCYSGNFPPNLTHILGVGVGGWKEGPQTDFILIENSVFLILQGSFHILEPTKPF